MVDNNIFAGFLGIYTYGQAKTIPSQLPEHPTETINTYNTVEKYHETKSPYGCPKI